MGMDYTGCRPKSETGRSLHLNWTGHKYLAYLLDQLECDLTEWSGSNDGARIKAATCRSWAKSIRKALTDNRLLIAAFHDQLYAGGERHLAYLIPKDIPANDSAQVLLALAGEVPEYRYYPLSLESGSRFRGYRKMDESTRRWLLGIADFFDNCGGCKQW